MKLVVFAHTPPPHHGQSYMVQLLLEGFGGDHRKRESKTNQFGIQCYHVNARFSRSLEDIGAFRAGKFLLVFAFVLQAIWCRFRYGAKTLYYIPAPGKKSALVRDWLVMFFCRPFFSKIILHWQAAGLAKWLETAVQIRTRSWTYAVLKQPDLGIVLSEYNRRDAEKLLTKSIVLVPNAIPDPCPDFNETLLPRRLARTALRKKLLANLSVAPLEREQNDPQIFKVLFVAHCTREKGLFDTLEGVAIANQQLTIDKSPIRLHLDVAGLFLNRDERAEFDTRVKQPDLDCAVTYRGFVGGTEKSKLFSESDCFCFPTFYFAESFPVVLVEAMAFGAQVITSRWRSLPDVMPKNYPGLVDPRSPRQIAESLLQALEQDFACTLRQHFLNNFTIEEHLKKLAEAFHRI